MDKNELTRAADPQVFVPHLRDNPPAVPRGEHHHDGIETVRTDTYRGHEIVVRTTYEIQIDGRPLRGHLGVGNDGTVHYHPLPNYSFESAIDLVRQVIDSFPEKFDDRSERPPHHGDGGHPHAHRTGA